MLRHSLKEWAAVCRALASGRQSLLLRKGGIAEGGDGEFHVEHTRFWLLPTFVHQQEAGIKESELPLLLAARAEAPPAVTLRLTHFADVTGLYLLHDIVGVLKVRDLHVWSDDTAAARFAYRRPGLNLLLLR